MSAELIVIESGGTSPGSPARVHPHRAPLSARGGTVVRVSRALEAA